MSMSQARAQDGSHLITRMHLKLGTPGLPATGFLQGRLEGEVAG